MKITKEQIYIRDLVSQYQNNDEQGVGGYNGKLNIRPKFQREFIYNNQQQVEVINSINNGYPLNSIYGSKEGDHYELIDGQQRIMSICNYVQNNFLVNDKNFKNLLPIDQETILNYQIDVYICEGNAKEKLNGFRIINIAGVPLTAQELRNAVYTGKGLTDAKSTFSQVNSPGAQMARDYLSGSAIRQEVLETVCKGMVHKKGMKNIESLMAKYQHHKSAIKLGVYFQEVMDGVTSNFVDYRKIMKGQPGGIFYNQYGKDKLDPAQIEKQTEELMNDDEVQSIKGIYHYILSNNPKYLNLRTFKDKIKQTTLDEQNHKCRMCRERILYENSEADHIIPGSKGGKTVPENCQVLCIKCNRQKGGK